MTSDNKMTKPPIILKRQDLTSYSLAEKIDLGEKSVSFSLIKDLIRKDEYYIEVLKLFNDEITTVKIGYKEMEKEVILLSLTKVEIVRGLSILQDELSGEEKERLDYLKEKISYKTFLNDYQKENFKIQIEGVNYVIPIILFIKFFNLPDSEFKKLCQSPIAINGLSKEYFLYASYTFFKIYAIEEYILPPLVYKHFESIQKQELVDIEAINVITQVKDPNIAKIKVNEELRKEVYHNLPNDLDILEKAIYIYYKLCKMLFYDDEFAANDKGASSKEHENYEHISTITPENNRVVCYEFNAIYAKFLEELGLNFETRQYKEEGFGGHASLIFRFQKYLIKADSVTHITDGDLIRAKIDLPLVGLTIINKNPETRKEFKFKVLKVRDYINKEYQDNKLLFKNVFQELWGNYQKQEMSIIEKLTMLISRVNMTNFQGMDPINFIMEIIYLIFKKEVNNQELYYVIIRNSENTKETTTLIFTIKVEGVWEYYYYNINGNLEHIEKEEIVLKFQKGTWGYIRDKGPFIPGLK